MDLEKGISVIIPTFNYASVFERTLNEILNQSLKPDEIIIVDSSINHEISTLLKRIKTDISINYIKVKKAFPGEARNIGFKNSKFNIIAIIDSKTVPTKKWIENGINQIKKNFDVSFGSTIYKPKTKYQKLLNSATFGNIAHETTPGTIIKRKIYEDNNFIENVRTADDYEWRERIKNKKYKFTINKNEPLLYDTLPNTYYETLKRYLIYSFHTAKVNVEKNVKDLYLGLFFVISILILPRLNYIIGWQEDINNMIHTLQAIILILLIFFSSHIIFKIFKKKPLFFFTNLIIQTLIILGVFIIIYNWNIYISKMLFESTFWIPHITKISIILIFISSFLFRGIIRPIIRNIQYRSIFPFNWLIVGFIGLTIDLVKAPGYLLGAIYYFLPIIKTVKKIKIKNKILFVCPYPNDVQAGQRLKFEQHFHKFREANYEIFESSFFDQNTWKVLYQDRRFFRKIYGTILGYIRRTLLLFQLYKYDILYIHMWVSPAFFSFFEYLYLSLGKKVIYDIEDNVLLNSNQNFFSFNPFVRNKNKYEFLIKSSNQIITSSPDLSKTCYGITKQNNVNYIPATINTKRYFPHKDHYVKDTINVGWTGTHSSKKYLSIVEPYLKKISKKRKIKFIIIGNFNYNIKNIDCELIEWSKNTEILDLLKIDIGIYPVFEDEWSLGKSGLKSLQYMALGIPSVSTNFGNIKKIVKHGHNGILTKNNNWDKALIDLIDNVELRKKIGKNSIQTVKDFYSIETLSEQYINVLKKSNYDN